MKDPKMNIKIRMTLYGWFAFKIYLPFMGALGLHDIQGNMFDDIKNNVRKYFVIKGININEEPKQ